MTERLEGQAPETSGQAPQTEQQGSAAAQGQEPERFDAEYVARLRAEAAGYRKRVRELEQVAKQNEDAKLSETERLQKRLAELERQQSTYEQERQERTLRYEVMLAAGRMGIVDPEAAYRLLDLASIEFDADGRPQAIDKALTELVQQKPYLRVQVSSGNPTNPARAGGSATFTKGQIADRAFWNAHREEILRAMAEGRIVDD